MPPLDFSLPFGGFRQSAPARAAGRDNHFGLLRIVFAALVVVSHSPELIDGNPSRELLTRMFGTITFGTFGVDCFFLISGYLITKSFVESGSARDYFVKRVARIYPGYLVAFAVCVVCVAPLCGAPRFTAGVIARNIGFALFLQPPEVAGVFPGNAYPALNGSMWTIAFEFRCYISAALLGLAGVYRGRGRWLLLAGIVLFAALTMADIGARIPTPSQSLVGDMRNDIRFLTIFWVGAGYYLFAGRIIVSARGAALAAVALVACLFERHIAEVGLAVFGGYLIVWFALAVPEIRPEIRLPRGREADISYGLYLYAYPVQNILIWHFHAINPWMLTALTLLIAGLLGAASWRFIERPGLDWARRRLARRRDMARG